VLISGVPLLLISSRITGSKPKDVRKEAVLEYETAMKEKEEKESE